ncbi:MAG: HPF/RaiA family ribosome-associated protein [Acidobacteria bacterium]|nr:HPF/RaiA family ribosome-associated protein [Acidobacteriota bacterium]
MKITFTGKQDKLNPSQERKLALAFARLSKLLERRGEKGAQVILSTQRHLQQAEVRVNFYDNTLVGAGGAADQFTAIMDAVEKVEKQAIKTRSKWRETKRATPTREARSMRAAPLELPEPQPAAKAKKEKPAKSKPTKVVKAGNKATGKPMTVEEALLVMEDDRDYLVYRDSGTDKVNVLIRRRDGKVDLVEA